MHFGRRVSKKGGRILFLNYYVTLIFFFNGSSVFVFCENSLKMCVWGVPLRERGGSIGKSNLHFSLQRGVGDIEWAMFPASSVEVANLYCAQKVVGV